MADSRIRDLGTQGSIDKNFFIAVDKSGEANATKITIENAVESLTDIYLGSAAQFGRDSDNYIGFKTDNECEIKTNSVQRLHINSSGVTKVIGSLLLDTAGDQNYKFLGIGSDNSIFLESQTAATDSILRLASSDQDQSDHVYLDIMGLGGSGDMVDTEFLRMGYDASAYYEIFSGKTGSGVLQKLHIYTQGNTNQLVLQTNGNVGVFISNPTSPFMVQRETNAVPLVEFNNTHTTNGYGLSISAGDDSAVWALRVKDKDSNSGLTVYGDLTTELHAGQKVNRTTVNAATYNLLATDFIVDVTYTDTGASTITIPTAQIADGRIFYVYDSDRNASVNNITVDTQGAETINEQNSVSIQVNGGVLMIFSDGTNWLATLMGSAPSP
jgi:hypothetical protein